METYKITTKEINDMIGNINNQKIDIEHISNYEDLRHLVDDWEEGAELEDDTEDNVAKMERVGAFYYSIVDEMEAWRTVFRC